MFESKISKVQFVDILVNGLKLSPSALADDVSISFYFQSLNEFINDSDNDFWAELIDDEQIIVYFGDIEYLTLTRKEDRLVMLTFSNGYFDPNNASPEEAKKIGNIVLGLIVFDEIWRNSNGEEVEVIKEIEEIEEEEEPRVIFNKQYTSIKTENFDFDSLKKYNTERWKKKFERNIKTLTSEEFYKIFNKFKF